MRIIALLLYVILSINALAQTEVTVMSYNLLNFPEGFLPDREDTLKKIIEYVQPDLFLVQELKNEVGLQAIVNTSFADVPGNYIASQFVSQQSNQDSDWLLQQAIIFNTEVFGMTEQRLKTTTVRDINIFKLYFKDQDLAIGADTTFLYVFNTHFKSSQGENNEQLRLEAAEVFVNELANIPPASYVLFGGDLNVYSSDEPAYQTLLDTENSIVMEDPIDAPGTWSSSSYPFKQILTQSTRVSQIYGDGAGGGIDDRFDFVLCSSNLKNSDAPVHIDIASYRALGNTGDCYNQNITQCDQGNDVPLSVIRAMYYMSDHLPIVFNLDLDFSLHQEHQRFSIAECPALNHRQLHLPAEFTTTSTIKLYTLEGRIIFETEAPPGSTITIPELSHQLFMLSIENDDFACRRKYLFLE